MVLPGICAAVQALNARMHALQQAGLSCKLCARPTMANAKCRDAPMLQVLIRANILLSSMLTCFANVRVHVESGKLLLLQSSIVCFAK